MDPYLLAKWLHILSATVLFGAGLGTAFSMVWAMRSDRAEVVGSVASGVVVADWIFTTPAGVLQPLTGLWLIHLTGFSPWEDWLLLTYGLYALAFLAWAPVVWLQYRIRDLALAAAPGPLPNGARRHYRIWCALGVPGFGTLVGVFWLMLSKPDLF